MYSWLLPYILFELWAEFGCAVARWKCFWRTFCCCFYAIYCWLLSESDYSIAQFNKINWISCGLTRLFFWSRELNAVPTCPVDKETIKMHEVSGYSFISAVSICMGKARQLRTRWLSVLRAEQFFVSEIMLKEAVYSVMLSQKGIMAA